MDSQKEKHVLREKLKEPMTVQNIHWQLGWDTFQKAENNNNILVIT